MKVLLVSSYPPRRCGIGRYAAGQAERLREQGHEVTVLTAPDGDGDAHAELLGGAALASAARIARRFDRVVVHFQPALYLPPRRPVGKVLAAWRLARLARRPNVEILVHEADAPPARWRPDYRLLAEAFGSASTVLFHTDAERRELERAYGVSVRARIVPHTSGVTLAGRLHRDEARRRLGLPLDEPIFVCAGFLHSGKGYDAAVRAFLRAGSPGRLYVLGEVRDPTPENERFAASLRRLCAANDRTELREGYLDDEAFDTWLAAADRLVLPYRRSWSSGALARAQVVGTPAIVAAVGGLPEQAGEADVVVADDVALSTAIAAAADRSPSRG